MSSDDYTYLFDAINVHFSTVSFQDHRADTLSEFQVAVDDQHVSYQLSSTAFSQVADMVDLALAVHIADRFAIRRSDRSAHIQITLPVRHPDLLQASDVLRVLRETLSWFTEDSWSFSFLQRKATGRPTELQTTLGRMLQPEPPVEVALWSGGLDSLAGLWQRQHQHPEVHYTLFGTGANALVLNRQRELLHSIRNLSATPFSLKQVPLRLHAPNLPRWKRNRYQRTRGFVFLLLGAVCAHLEGQSILHIYENGIGALNLPFRPAEVGVDHSRAVHPLSLLKMSTLVTKWLGEPFTFVNPFLFQTKAEMCASLQGTAAETLISSTMTCDSISRHHGSQMQCGCCSSCLLRRQALAALGLIDQTDYVYQDFSDPRSRFVLDLMLGQRDTLQRCFTATDPWAALRSNYPILEKTRVRTAEALGMPPSQVSMHMLRLYERYVGEWNQAQHLLDSASSRIHFWAA
jgi:hypothetical protein